MPESLAGRNVHVHNRLIVADTSPVTLRTRIAHNMVQRLAQTKGHTALLLPLKCVEAWDIEGEALHDPVGLQAFMKAAQSAAAQVTNSLFSLQTLHMHINDAAFFEAVLAVFDDCWREAVFAINKRQAAKTI